MGGTHADVMSLGWHGTEKSAPSVIPVRLRRNTSSMTRLFALLLAAILSSFAPSVAVAGSAHTITVSSDPSSGLPRFDPPILFIEPGDTVRLEMAGKVYASRLIAGMHPPAAASWWGQVGEDLEITLTEPGVYGHKCGGSYALGLVGLIVVGDPSPNLEAARAVQHPPAATRVLDELFATLANRD
jgi:pseudoazurin